MSNKVVVNTETNKVTVIAASEQKVVSVVTAGPKGDKGADGAAFSGILTGSLNVSGSINLNGELIVSQNVIAQSFTGSLFGTSSFSNYTLSASFSTTSSYAENSITASYIKNAETASFVLNSVSISSSFSLTASYIDFAQTASYVESAQSASFVLLANSASFSISSSLSNAAITASYIKNAETASFVLNAVSSSFAITASYIEYENISNKPSLISGSSQVQLSGINGTTFADIPFTFPNDLVIQGNLTAEQLIVSNSVYFVTTSFYSGSTVFGNSLDDTHQFTGSILVNGGITASLFGTASFSNNSATASYILASSVQGLNLSLISSGSATASITPTEFNVNVNSKITGSLNVSNGITGSLFGTASWAQNSVTSSFSNFAQSASFVQTSQTASFVTGSIFGSGNLALSSSYSLSSSISQNSLLFNGAVASSFINTGSAGNVQTISGSLIINQNLTVFGSSSIIHVTSSQLNISTNLITVNTQLPTVRFGGLAVIDSGSSPQQSGSFLYDSVQDEWIFVHRGSSTTAVTSSHFLMGPESYGGIGNETYVGVNKIFKSSGNEHVTSSNITDDGVTVTIVSNAQVTGSLKVTGSFSIDGNTGTIFSSNVDTIIFTGSFYQTGSFILSGSLNVSSGITGSLLGTSSYSLTASYIDGGFY